MIQTNISTASDNATGILNGAIYTPATFQTTVKPMISVSTVPTTPDVQVTASKGDLSVSGTTGADGKVELEVTAFGIWTVSGTVDTEQIQISVSVSEIKQYSIILAPTPTVFGVIWDGSASTLWSRTDGSELFTDPQPAVGNGSGSSPFDNIMPWSGMTRVSDPVAGELVQIPKYYYKWTQSGSSLQLQIANEPQDGFYVSPAHADRGDGQGERDFVYVGRYHCSPDYKSDTGTQQISNIERSVSRSAIHNLGNEYWQFDLAMRWTIAMLYLVEFANWNSQNAIGWGSSANGTRQPNGTTDDMAYHTGTTSAQREQYGFCQYRNIEGLWDNVYDWCDGCYFTSQGLNVILNPNLFSDTENGVLVGLPVDGYPSKMQTTDITGYEWVLYSVESEGSQSTYIPDYMYFNGIAQNVSSGGRENQKQIYGMFYIGYQTAPGEQCGTRLMKLPNNT